MAGQAVQGDADAGDDHAADVIFLAVHNGCRRGGAEIKDDQRRGIFMDGSHGVDDEVRTGGGRIVHENVQAGADARAHNHGLWDG